MIEVKRENDDVAVYMGGKEVEVFDSSDDYILAECTLDDLSDEAVQKLPSGLALQIHSPLSSLQ